MPEMTSYPPGSFCWADLATTDTEAAKAFYGRFLGWDFEEMPTPAGTPYIMLLRDGKQVCGLYAMGPDRGGAPPHWRSYVAVASVDAAAATVTRFGGSVLMPPLDALDAGRLAIVQDPTGGVLGLWQGNRHQGAQLWNEPGAICWNEFMTHDLERAGRFFGEVFGWNARLSRSVNEGPYYILHAGDTEVGGMLRIEPEWGQMPSGWTIYFGVEDCDKSVEAAKGLGAFLLFPVMQIEGIGRFAYLQDPQGAVFAIIDHSHAS